MGRLPIEFKPRGYADECTPCIRVRSWNVFGRHKVCGTVIPANKRALIKSSDLLPLAGIAIDSDEFGVAGLCRLALPDQLIDAKPCVLVRDAGFSGPGLPLPKDDRLLFVPSAALLASRTALSILDLIGHTRAIIVGSSASSAKPRGILPKQQALTRKSQIVLLQFITLPSQFGRKGRHWQGLTCSYSSLNGLLQNCRQLLPRGCGP